VSDGFYERNKTWLALWCAIIICFMAYGLGKDRALRDNRVLGPYDNSVRG
jgi:hypothetical protein